MFPRNSEVVSHAIVLVRLGKRDQSTRFMRYKRRETATVNDSFDGTVD